LKSVSEKLDRGEEMKVEIVDSSATTFICYMDQNVVLFWKHFHLCSTLLIKISQISWVKYLVTWSKSGLGHYAEIDIAEVGGKGPSAV
jgi:hypothetical protein